MMAPDKDEVIPRWQLPLLALFDAATIAAIPLQYLMRKIKMKYLKHIGMCVFTALVINSIAVQANAGSYDYATDTTTEIVNQNPPSTFTWSGPYVGVHGGVANVSQTLQFSKDVYETGVRDILENQCWKFWQNDWNKLIDDRYCDGGFQGMNQHYFDNAKLREGVVVGSEEYEYVSGTETWEETTKETFAIYGAHLGYLHDFGGIVAGVEASHTLYESELFPIDAVTTLKARAGFDMGRLQPYAHVGYSWASGVADEGMSYGGGVDWAITDKLRLGFQYSHYDFSEYEHDAMVLTASVAF